ncbi:MAG: glycosyltransferase [Candidatus Hydrogenedentes bacterium]|nr:glycosyltransferase [Candidatus Hydrogenedentota bacterium]
MSRDCGKPVRVLMLNYEYPPVGGGAANATQYVLREIMKTGRATVDLVTSGTATGDSVVESVPGLRIHRLDVRKKNLHYWTHREIITWFVRAVRYTWRLADTDRFDCCHAWFGFPAGLVARIVCRDSIPYIVSLRGSDVPGFNRRFAVHYHVLRPILRHVWRSAAAVVANSGGLRGLALDTDPASEISIVPNGIDTFEFAPAETAPEKPFRVLCVSRLISRKAVDVLIRAFVDVRKAFSDAELMVVGDGIERSALGALAIEAGLGDAVRFEGRIPHERMAETYRAAHLFVLPSRWEGMSNALLEAMACGLPVVTADTGGVSELVGDNGIVVPPDDERKLAEAIIAMLRDDYRRHIGGQFGRAVAERFSWSTTAERYLDMYCDIIGRQTAAKPSAKAAVARL